MRSIKTNWERLRRAFLRERLPVLSPQEGYERWADSYGENMNPLQVLESETVARLMPDVQSRVVLDLGCGKGRVARLAIERGAASVTGVDLSERMLLAAEKLSNGEVTWVQADALHLPFAAATFDVVTCALMMGHVEDLDAAVDEIARVLRPGGSVLLSDFHPAAALSGLQRTFTDNDSGLAFAIENHPHRFEDYARVFETLDIEMEELEERSYQGQPVVFVMRARRR